MAAIEITLGDGRIARVTQFWAKATYDGFIEGDLEAMNAEIRRSFSERALEISRIDAPLCTVLPASALAEPLPAYVCVAYLESMGAVQGQQGDVSYLGLAWLSDAVSHNLAADIARILKSVSWNAAARSATWLEYA